jgi:Type IV secretory system Conjugative DNA transfer
MQTTKPLLRIITNILQAKLNRLPHPVRTRLSALKDMCLATLRAFLPEPDDPPVKKVPPTPGRPTRPGQYPPQPGAAKPPSPHGKLLPASVRPARGVVGRDEEAIRTVLGTDIQTGEAVTISLKERLLGMYVIGATGTGKTTFDLNMILSDISHGCGIALIEPHDLTRAVIAAMPEERLKDVIYLDLTDASSSFSLNFFECPAGADDTEAAKVASFVMHVFEKVWQVGPETPRLAQVVRNTTRLLIENPSMTFAEIPLLLWEDVVREKLVRRASNIHTKLFFSQYNKRSPREREELTASTINKVDAYLNEPLIARIVSQSASTIDFRRIMDEGKILLVNLSPQLEEASRLIGAVVIGRLLMAAFSRSDTPDEDKRRPFMLYCDEFQRFATSDFATFLAEARKFKISSTISNQILEQLDDINRATALQVATLVAFRVSGDDSGVLTRSFDATPTPELVGEEPVRAPVADPLSFLVRHGSPNAVVARFTAEYLIPLHSLIREVGTSSFAFQLGCAFVLPRHVIEGQRQLSEAIAACMREGRADVFLPPWALFALGGASDPDATYAFYKDLRHQLGYLPVVGFDTAANRYGGASFDPTRDEDVAFLRQGVKTSIFESTATRERRVSAFIRMYTALRQTLGVLAKEPLLTDTGLFQPKYHLRSYKDQENLVANELSQLPNYTAKIRLLSGEHTITTRPAPVMVSEQEVEARIKAIKQRMLRDGVTRPALEIEEAVRKRHETLRQRPASDAPPSDHPTGKRHSRNKPPAA